MENNKLHILVVDDDDRIRSLLKEYLNENNFIVSTAENSEEAKKKLSYLKFDIVILDVMMPGQSGYELTEEVKKNIKVPIILLTAKGEVENRIKGLELGADDYVTKPFSVRELMLRIKAILKRNTQEGTTKSNSVISFDGLNVDEESHEVYVNDVEINLTALEFKLLKHLLDRRGRVQTRDQLLEEVWGYSSHVTTRTVDTHVKRLREKLKEMGKHIQTIRGVGYRFSRSSD